MVFSVLLLMLLHSATSINFTPLPKLSIQFYEFSCIGGDLALLSTGVRLSYTSNSTGSAGTVERSYSGHVWVDYNSSLPELQYFEGSDYRNVISVDYIFEQLEHGGGSCHCFNITDSLTSTFMTSLCGGNPQIPRSVKIHWSSSTYFVEQKPILEQAIGTPLRKNCTGANYKIDISYTVYASMATCGSGGSVENRDVLEFSIRFSSFPYEWIPLSYTIINRPSQTVCRHGYCVEDAGTLNSNSNSIKPYTRRSIQICGFSLYDSIQLRWLMQSVINVKNSAFEDRWSLDDIQVSLITESNSQNLLMEDFDMPSLNEKYWNSINIRNGNLSSECSNGSNNQALSFGKGINRVPYAGFIVSHSAVTNSIDLITASITTKSTESTTKSISDYVVDLENETINQFQQTISNVLSSNSTDELLSQLSIISMSMTEHDLVVVYILGVVLNNATSFMCGYETLQQSIDIGSNIILQTRNMKYSASQSLQTLVLGSTLLLTLERLVIPCSENSSYTILDTAGVQIQELLSTDADISINTSTFIGWTSPFTTAHLSLSNFEMFSINKKVRIIGNLYRNISNILPVGMNNSTLVSDVFGISLQCGDDICPTSNISLKNFVQIVFNHDTGLKSLLRSNNSKTTTCVFLDITTRSTVFQLGEWSARGCTKNEDLSSSQRTVCECNHLTHFAILLSARPVTISNRNVQLSLNIISYIGVSVSLIAMTILIFVFTCFRSLRSLRNYIHINLCINLAIAQIVFVAGIDKTDDTVPIHCKIVAVLLHYFFLVSFMWMLMEGVFLYVTLVKVFVKKQSSYYVAFTALSYGLPLVYMGGLTLPLGFSYLTPPGYGYSIACYLETERGFVWAFIAPVILIFLANIGFLIMAIVIMCKHQKKLKDKSRSSKVKNWLKTAISLTVIMGITWIFGLLIVVDERLLSFVYIYTILVALQGFFIFVLFVLLSKSVHDTIKKHWRVQVTQSDFLSRHFGQKMSNQLKSHDPHHSNPLMQRIGNTTGTTGLPCSTATQNDDLNQFSYKSGYKQASYDTSGIATCVSSDDKNCDNGEIYENIRMKATDICHIKQVL